MAQLAANILIGAVAAGIVAVLGMLGSRAHPNAQGYRQLKPGPMHWTGAVLGSGLFFLMAYVWLFVGSKRADGEMQMRILFCLTVACGLATIFCARSIDRIKRSAVRWRHGTIIFRMAGGDARFACHEARAMRSTPSGVVVAFDGGASVCIDPYAVGGAELLDMLNKELSSRQPGA